MVIITVIFIMYTICMMTCLTRNIGHISTGVCDKLKNIVHEFSLLNNYGDGCKTLQF